ncbi:hypothetical protein FQZ97_1161050 [compost metagenome]
MVGTSSASATCSFWIASSTATGSKRGTITWQPPLASIAFMKQPSARWNIGAACRPTQPRAIAPSATIAIELVKRLRCESITPFGEPVVPPV